MPLHSSSLTTPIWFPTCLSSSEAGQPRLQSSSSSHPSAGTGGPAEWRLIPSGWLNRIINVPPPPSTKTWFRRCFVELLKLFAFGWTALTRFAESVFIWFQFIIILSLKFILIFVNSIQKNQMKKSIIKNCKKIKIRIKFRVILKFSWESKLDKKVHNTRPVTSENCRIMVHIRIYIESWRCQNLTNIVPALIVCKIDNLPSCFFDLFF